MAFTLNNYKCAGVIFQIDEMGYTKKSNWPKRHFYLEVPSSSSGMQKTEIFKFLVMGDEAGSLDWYHPGDWVEVLFRVEGRWWQPPDEDGVKQDKVHLMSLRPIDIHKGDNPFNKDIDDVSQDPDDYSPDFQAELAQNVKDWANQPTKDDPFTSDDDINDLPF